ncbi:hypothetical protein VPH35_030777 [Triticum aestivum]
MASSNSSIRFSDDAVEDIRWQEDLGVLEDDDSTTPMRPFAQGNTPKSKCLRMHNHERRFGDGLATTNDQILQATKESNKLMQTLIKKIDQLEYMVVKHMQACDKKTEMP